MAENTFRGVWEVVTAHSIHHLDFRDLDAPLWRRSPRAETEDGLTPTAMATDGEWVPLYGILAVRFTLDGARIVHAMPTIGDLLAIKKMDGKKTVTTEVLSVRRLGDASDIGLLPESPVEGLGDRVENALKITSDPTRCFATGCGEENELLLHVRDDPWGGIDLCWEHAEQAWRQEGAFMRACGCPFCERAEKVATIRGWTS